MNQFRTISMTIKTGDLFTKELYFRTLYGM